MGVYVGGSKWRSASTGSRRAVAAVAATLKLDALLDTAHESWPRGRFANCEGAAPCALRRLEELVDE
jgi:phage/plasmid primase-like uncharacterized protein